MTCSTEEKITQMTCFLNNWTISIQKNPRYEFNLCIVIRNEKIVWKHRPYCLYFFLNLKYLGWPYREYLKTAKYGGFCEELLRENDFEAVLATFCCCDYGTNASEVVQKIATDQKDYRKCSSCAIVCWITKYINNSEKRLVTTTPSM